MINVSQMRYAKEVLGLDLVIQPPRIRGLYRLHKHNEAPAFLFFAHGVEAAQKQLIQKINKALSSSSGWIVELLSPRSADLIPLFPSLLIKFRPKGFVVFADEHTKHLFEQHSLDETKKPEAGMWFFSKSSSRGLTCSLYAGGGGYVFIPGCLLSSLDMFFTSPARSSSEVSRTKQEAWKNLQWLAQQN